MAKKRSAWVVLMVVIVMGVATIASADGTAVWPSGTNPKAPYAPVNGFCDCYQAIQDNALLTLLPPAFVALLTRLTPGVGDINGVGSWVNLANDPVSLDIVGNGILDCDVELRLVEEVPGFKF